MTEALAPRRRLRLAVDLPMAICTLATLAPSKGNRSYVLLTPLGDGRVAAEAGGGALLGLIEVAGELAQPLAIPARAMRELQRRHPGATVMAIDAPPDDGPDLLRLLALGPDGSATINTPAAEPAGGSAAALLEDVALVPWGSDQSATLNPLLLKQALAALARLCPDQPVTLSMPSSDLIGVLLTGKPAPDGDSGLVAATVAIARMLTP